MMIFTRMPLFLVVAVLYGPIFAAADMKTKSPRRKKKSKTESPFDQPSDMPSDQPSDVPSDQPSDVPSSVPSDSAAPSVSAAPSAVPSAAPSVSAAPSASQYRRKLSSFDDASLYRDLEDKDFQELSKNHVEFFDDAHKTIVARCAHRESKFYGQEVSIHDCIHPDNRVGPDMEPGFLNSYEPWVSPNHVNAKLVANNPGIWSIDDFLSEQEVEILTEILMRNGNEGMFGPCTDAGKNPMTSQPSTNKECYMIGWEKMCEGPYHYSACEHDTKPEDAKFIKIIQERAANIMVLKDGIDVNLEVPHQMKMHRATGSTPPQLLHEDAYDYMTFMMYLTDNGAKTVFPEAGVSILPKRGRAAMWLNSDEKGYGLKTGFHAVEPHLKDSGDRMVAILPFSKDPSHMPMGRDPSLMAK